MKEKTSKQKAYNFLGAYMKAMNDASKNRLRLQNILPEISPEDQNIMNQWDTYLSTYMLNRATDDQRLSITRPPCMECKGPVPPGRTVFCCDDHMKRWTDRQHIKDKRMVARMEQSTTDSR